MHQDSTTPVARALLVQPDTAVSAALIWALERQQIECLRTATQKQALKTLENDCHIDVVLVAMSQGGCCAMELLQAIRDNLRYQYLPVIMTCSGCPANVVVEALRHGASDVFSLPSSDEQIIRRITAAMAKGKRRILVVDDEPVIREYLTDLLVMERLMPIAVSSGQEALELLEKTEMHAVISDIMMPGISGMDLLVQIKSNHANIPVILITGYGGRFSPQEVLAAGADGYFQKPFKNVDLIRTLRGVLNAYTQSRIAAADSIQL